MRALTDAEARLLAGRLGDHLGRTDQERLGALLDLAGAAGRATVAEVHARLSPGLDADAANKALSRFVERISEAAGEAS